MEAWQRRELVKEWNDRKLAHIAAVHANTNFDNPDNKKQERLEELEQSYERVKADIMNAGGKESSEMEAEYDSEFMRAGRRAVARSVINADPIMPGEQGIRRLP